MERNNHIRVFISSTFKDLARERDELVNNIFPFLAEEAEKRGAFFTYVDLRWGIPKGGSSYEMETVIATCLNEITDCKPFFIGLIGERYGTCPKMKDIRYDGQLGLFQEFLTGTIAEGKSLTEMEIMFRLSERCSAHPFFYIRRRRGNKSFLIFDIIKNALNINKIIKLRSLRKKIENGFRPKDFIDVRELGDKVKKDFLDYLDSEYPHIVTEREKSVFRTNSYIDKLCDSYLEDKESLELKQIDEWFNNSNLQILIIKGDSGCGKSSLVARWLKKDDLLENPNVIYYFPGIESKHQFQDLELFFGRIIKERLGCKLQIKEDRPYEIAQSLQKNNQNILLVIDEIQNLCIDGSVLTPMYWAFSLPSNVKILVTTNNNDPNIFRYEKRGCCIYEKNLLSPNQKTVLISQKLKPYGKGLSKEILASMVTNSLTSNPYILNSLLEEIIAYGESDINERIGQYLNTNSPDSFFKMLIDNYIGKYEYQTDNSHIYKELLVVFSILGLKYNENEIIKLLKIKNEDWSRFYCSFKQHLIIIDGKLSLRHEILKKAIKDYLSLDNEFVKSIRLKLINNIESDTALSTFKEELAFQYYSIGKLFKDADDIQHWGLALDYFDKSLALYKTIRDENKFDSVDSQFRVEYYLILSDIYKAQILSEEGSLQNDSTFAFPSYFDRIHELAGKRMKWQITPTREGIKTFHDFFILDLKTSFQIFGIDNLLVELAKVYSYNDDGIDVYKKMFELVNHKEKMQLSHEIELAYAYKRIFENEVYTQREEMWEKYKNRCKEGIEYINAILDNEMNDSAKIELKQILAFLLFVDGMDVQQITPLWEECEKYYFQNDKKKLVSLYYDMGVVYFNVDYDESITFFIEVLKILSEMFFSSTHFDYYKTYFNLGLIYILKISTTDIERRYYDQQSISYFEECITIAEKNGLTLKESALYQLLIKLYWKYKKEKASKLWLEMKEKGLDKMKELIFSAELIMQLEAMAH